MWFVRLVSLIRIVNLLRPQTFFSPENAKGVWLRSVALEPA